MRRSRPGTSARFQLGDHRAESARRLSTGARTPVREGPSGLMRIGVDARELCGHPTGVGRYLGGLLLEWAALRGSREFVLYAPDATRLPLDMRRFATRTVPGPPGTWWEQVRVPRAAA